MELAYKLLDDAIKSRLKRNIVKQKSFKERIQKTLSKYHGKFEDYETLFPQFEEVGRDLTSETRRKKELELSDEELVFYDVILMGREYVESDRVVKQIAVEVTDHMRKNTQVDWLNQEHVKANIRLGVRKILLKSDFPIDKIEKVVPVIMQQAEINYGEAGFEN